MCVDLVSVKGWVGVFPGERENFTDPQGRSHAPEGIASTRDRMWLTRTDTRTHAVHGHISALDASVLLSVGCIFSFASTMPRDGGMCNINLALHPFSLPSPSYFLLVLSSPPPLNPCIISYLGKYETVQCVVSLLCVRMIDGFMLKLCFTLVLFFIISCV